jgi:CRP-like cAMP-binding protein
MSSEFASLVEQLPGLEFAFTAGAYVFHLADRVRFVHIVRTGVIHLVRHHDDGQALILQRAATGSVLAEASVYSACYHCDARAETSATTWASSREVLLRCLGENPDWSRVWARHLAQEVQRARLHAEILSLRTVAARLAAWIACNGPLPGKGQWFAIAKEIGVSSEALYREIARQRRR